MTNKSKSEEEIYYAALKEPRDDRSAYVKTACGDDLELLERVESLLKIRENPNNFLDSPPFIDTSLPDTSLQEQTGTAIGRYKLLEKIGEGGMAVVYMAEQEIPIHRKVALKIIKLGMDTKSVIARFEAERQALAMMDHPNIAKVLDAGATETGRPYFVMELVTGVSITEYCDNNNLSTKERLFLFIQVCNAVQHAHQKGIIHRDIKPSNVMVTRHNGKPVPKVIDFGVAKAINQKLTEKTLFTRYAHIIGTPAYMSPEQAELSDVDIDTRTDIYSLGVLLYELLTGTTPFSEEELRKGGYIEMQQVIREQEPVKPSTKLSTLGQTLSDVAKQHSSTPDVLRKGIRGDLDWIVMKSLEKDRGRRYETPDALSRDVQRYLKNEPIEACPPSAMYRLRKFVRRNKTVAVAVVAIAASLVIGVSFATWQAVRERALRMEAQRQQARAETNLRLALEALDEIYVRVTQKRGPEGSQSKGEEQTLLNNTLEFYERFAETNRDAPETWPLVEQVYGKVLTIRRKFVEQWPHVIGYNRALAAATVQMASLLENEGRTDKAEQTYEQAVHAQEQLVDSFPTVTEYRTELAATHEHLTNLLLSEGQNNLADGHRTAAKTLRSAAQSATQSKQIAPIQFRNFADPAGLQLSGGASVANDRLLLTPLAPNSAGVAWTAKKCLVALGFDTVFAFRLEGEADGFAFTVQNRNGSSMGSYGGSLGYGGIPNSLAVEFDMFSNQEFDDLPANHISVQTNGTGVNSADHVFSLSGGIVPVDLNDGNVHHVRIRYVPGTLTIFVDRSTDPMLKVSVELSALLDLDRGRAWIGFTAGTGSELHSPEILSWQYAPLVDEDTADSFFRSHPPKAVKPNHPLASVQQKERPLSESAPLSEDFTFLSKALAFYQAFAEQNRDDPNAQWQIGKAYWRVGEIMRILGGTNKEGPAYRQSEEACQTAMKIWETLSDRLPADAEAIRQLALTFHRSGLVRYGLRDYEKAIQYYERSVRLDAGNADFHNALAWVLALCPDPQLHDLQRAVTLAVEATRLDPDGPSVWNTLGVAQYYTGKWQQAIESLHKSDALEAYKGSSFNGFFLAMAYWQLGKRQEARVWYDRAVRWMDENLPGDEELLRFRAEAGQLLNRNGGM